MMLDCTKNSKLIVCCLFFLLASTSCSRRPQEDAGKKLAASYCASCHQFPEPALLPKEIWKTSVLPVMSNFMGLHFVGDSVQPLSRALLGADSAVLPPKVSISPADFMQIMKYYLAEAPDSLLAPVRVHKVTSSTSLFEVLKPALVNVPPFTSALVIDTASGMIYQGDAASRDIRVFDKDLKEAGDFHTDRIATHLNLDKGQLWVTDIGSLKPGPGAGSGDIIRLQISGGVQAGGSQRAGGGVQAGGSQQIAGGQRMAGAAQVDYAQKPLVLLDSLNRSVQSISVDLDNDGKKDWLVCEFGFLNGNFSWYKNMGGGKFQRRLIKAVPGAIQAYVEDVNGDGKPDIWVLFAQAREGISLFINQGGGHFEEKRILQFPPIYGSSNFSLADINQDGKEDIIYTCGDNADYSQVLKPYHGVYIFLNEGNFQFKQQYFFPMYGCYKAMALDFGHRGKPDLACISYFADYDHHPEESFIYLRNQSQGDSLDFVPYTIDHLPEGRWICMDAGDVDKDGYPDIVLGNLAAPYQGNHGWMSTWMQAPPFVLLRNIQGQSGRSPSATFTVK
jgi:hypothetical protein